MIKHLLKKALGIYELERKINNQKDIINSLEGQITSLNSHIQSIIADIFKLEKLSDLEIYNKYQYIPIQNLNPATKNYLFDRYNFEIRNYISVFDSNFRAVKSSDTIGQAFEKHKIIINYPVPSDLIHKSENISNNIPTKKPAKKSTKKSTKKSAKKAKVK